MNAADPRVRRILPAIEATSRNPVRIDRVTCAVCATPCAPDELCSRCLDHSYRWGRGSRTLLADRVVPLQYAIRYQQSYQDAWAYKEALTPPEKNHSLYRLQVLAFLFSITHAKCINSVASNPIDALVTVPSLSGRVGNHPLEHVTRFLPEKWARIQVQPSDTLAGDRNQRRIVNPENYVVPHSEQVRSRHIAVLEDTWTSGGHAQSMAVKLKQLGAVEVSVIVLSRDLAPGWGENSSFVRAYLTQPYDLFTCPVTGGACPPARR